MVGLGSLILVLTSDLQKLKGQSKSSSEKKGLKMFNLEKMGLNSLKPVEIYIGQATKGSRWIPWHTEAMKDVVTCDKSRGAGNTL